MSDLFAAGIEAINEAAASKDPKKARYGRFSKALLSALDGFIDAERKRSKRGEIAEVLPDAFAKSIAGAISELLRYNPSKIPDGLRATGTIIDRMLDEFAAELEEAFKQAEDEGEETLQ